MGRESMSENVKIVPASCTQCGGSVEVDPNSEKATCPFCGTTFFVEKAINNYNVQHATIEHADNVNIDMSGTVKTVLDFVGDQIKEGREERKEQRKIDAEKDKIVTQGTLSFQDDVDIIWGTYTFWYEDYSYPTEFTIEGDTLYINYGDNEWYSFEREH